MDTNTCFLCGRLLVDGDVTVPLREHGSLGFHERVVHLQCLRPLPRETPPPVPTLTDEEIG